MTLPEFLPMFNARSRSLDFLVAAYVAIALLVGVLVVRGVFAAGDSKLKLARQDAQLAARSTAAALTKEIGSIEHFAQLFVQEEQSFLLRVLTAGDPESLIFDLSDLATRWFPGALAFTLTDASGVPVVSDFKGGIGKVCLDDLKRNARGEMLRVPLHSGGIPHIDIVVPILLEGARLGSFMVSFTTASFATSISTPGDSRYLVAFIKESSAAPPAEAFDVPAARSDVVVRGQINPAFLVQFESDIRRDLELYLGAFAAFAVLGGVALWRARQRILADADELRHVNRDLDQLARTDPLTGLSNRRALHQQTATIFAQASREGKMVALALFDIDHFKRLNDTLGHAAGDASLVSIGWALAETAKRPLDLAVRYGGEEFLVCWYDTGGEHAARLAAGIAEKIRALPAKHANGSPLTVSAGVVVRPPDCSDSLEALLKEADAALYRAKLGGRDRIEFA